jgi:hypothetical protein
MGFLDWSRVVGKQEVIRAANWLAIVSVGETSAFTLIDRLAGHFLGCEPSPSFASSATLPSALSELRQSFYGRLGTWCVLCGH